MGRNKILSGDCFTVVTDFDGIVDQMTVPLIQGMLKYAFKADPAKDQGSCTSGSCDKEWAEGWAFAAAVLPRLHYCSYEIADLVRGNLDVANVAPMKDGFAELKAQVESLYPCLGITCADVGEFQNSAGVYTGAEACTDDGHDHDHDDHDSDECENWLVTEETTESPEDDDHDDHDDHDHGITTEAPATAAPAKTTAAPTEPSVIDSMAYPFAALSGIIFLANA
jgi:hypothetical protein